MSLDTLEVEGDDTVEEGLIGRKDFSMLRLVVQCRSYRAGRLGHVCFLLAPCATPDTDYSMPRTSFQQARAKGVRVNFLQRGRQAKEKGIGWEYKKKWRRTMEQTPEEHWRDLSERILTEISEWRRSHPKATFREIEDEVHTRMSRLEAQLIGGYGAAEYEPKLERSEPTGVTNVSSVSDLLACYARKHQRKLQGAGGQAVTLSREYGTCPNCGSGLFPPR